MAKRNVNIRLRDETIEAVEAWAEDHELTRTGAIEDLITKGLQPERSTNATNELTDVLRQSNADLRATVATLTMQLAEKDRQIAKAHELADQAHRMHAALIVKALPERTGLWNRITSWVHPRDERNTETGD